MTTRQFFIRAVIFLCLMVAWYLDVWWLGSVLLVWYCYQYRAVEVVVLGILIDVQFTVGTVVPWYTLCFAGAVLLSESLKPLLRTKKVTHL